MDFNTRDYLEFVLLSLYRHIAIVKGVTTAQVKAVIEKKWGPFHYVLDELIPLLEVECSLIQLKFRIKSCFQEAAEQDVDMHEYHKLWKSLSWWPMPRKRKPRKSECELRLSEF
jgi:hypothetical protein